MLCSKHFEDTSFTSSDRTKLTRFAIPSEAKDLLKKFREELDPSSFILKGKENISTENDHNYAKISSESSVCKLY